MMGRRGGVAVVSPTSNSGRKHGEESAFLLQSFYHPLPQRSVWGFVLCDCVSTES